MTEPAKILWVDDEANILKSIRRLFMDMDTVEIIPCASGEEALEIIRQHPDVQVVVSDYRMPGMNGIDFLRQINDMHPETIRIVLSGYADTGSVVGAINEGRIYKFIAKPWNDDALRVTISKAIELYRLQQENTRLNVQLQKTNEELKSLNANLEQLVVERTEELLFKNQALTASQNILDALPVGVLGMSLDGMCVLANRAGAAMFPGVGAGPIGMEISDALSEEICAVFRRVIDHGKDSRQVATDTGVAQLCGVRMWYESGQEGVVFVFLDKSGPCLTM